VIALLGATGYTGKLVAAELARLELPHRLGGRDPAKLGALPPDGVAEPFVVDATDPARLDLFLDGATAIISCAGPFARIGLAVVEAAVRNGVPYLDSAGEREFMRLVYERFTEARVPLVPACGFDFVPGDLAAAVAAAAVGGRVREVVVGYDLGAMSPSRGTVRTMLGAARSGGGGPALARTRRVRFPSGEKDVVEVPWGEQLTVPRHVPGATVVAGFVAPPLAGPALSLAAGAMRLVAPALEPLVGLLPEGPPARRRRRASFTIVADARGEGARRSAVVCEGRDVYGLTARFLVAAARRVGGAGALTPAQALDPVPFLDAVSGDGPTGRFEWRRM